MTENEKIDVTGLLTPGELETATETENGPGERRFMFSDSHPLAERLAERLGPLGGQMYCGGMGRVYRVPEVYVVEVTDVQTVGFRVLNGPAWP